MTNLLQETLDTLKQHDKTPSDVLWVGAPAYGYMTWDEYAAIADVNYYSGYGSQEVAKDLVIVGKGWCMERGEYDGSEWWDFKTPPKKPKHHRPAKSVIGGMWASLERISSTSEGGE